jgi:cytochrome c biogenesis protein
MMAGFYMTFFMSHRRIWVRMTEKKGGTLVEMAGSSHRNRAEFEKQLDRVSRSLRESSLRREKENTKEDPA